MLRFITRRRGPSTIHATIPWPANFTVTALLGLMIGLSIASVRCADAADKPNVLFIICDDLNCDIGCYGDDTMDTPNIDALAARGVQFADAHCQYPLCGPSRASFMTGMYPDQTGIVQNAIFLRETLRKDVRSMPMAFRDAGYHATRIGKLYHYDVPLHIGTGGHDDPYSWDRTLNPIGHDRKIHDKIFTLEPGRFGGTMSWYADDGPDERQTDGIAATMAEGVLAEYARGQTPFFLAVGLYRPHTPYVAPKPYFEKYPVDEITVPQVPDGYLETLPGPARQTLRAKKAQRDLSPVLARSAIQAYHASISFADAQIGRILDALDQNGLRDNTIIVFTSDHGYHMGQHDWYQKQTLFTNGTRVPMIIAGPGVSVGGRSASMAEMVDLFPTLCDLADIETPSNVAGMSLTPTLADPSVVVRDDALSRLRSGVSLVTPEYRITAWGERGEDGFEFYDREKDPEEMVNRADDPALGDVIAEMKQQLFQRAEAAKEIPPKVRRR